MSINFRSAVTQSLATAWPAARSVAATTIDLAKEYAPVFGRRATLARNRVVVGPYARPRSLFVTLLWLAAVPAGLLLCLFYGIFFGMTAPYLMVPSVVPIAVMVGIIIWALPDQRTAPTLAIEFLTAAFFVSKIIWPSYLAISLPGLPWISILRIIGLPLAAYFLISLSVSKNFRAYTYESVSSIKALWICVVGFFLVQIYTTIISHSPFASAEAVFDQQVNFALMFIVGAVLFRKYGMVERYLKLFCALSILIIIITAIEHSKQHIIWAAHIPDILHPRVPSVENTLRPSFRMYTNVYRAKATFSTPLALSEFISLLTPFFLFFGLSNGGFIVKTFCFAMVPITFVAVRMTDARLGVVGVFASVLMYGFLWSVARWRTRPKDLLAAATVYAYPAIFLAAVGAILASNRLSTMVFGGGAQAGSTEARSSQLQMAAAAFWRQPWGYGAGQSGLKMGFAKDSFVTIDNFFISVELDYGLFGIIFWYGMFLSAILTAIFYSLSDRYAHRREAHLLAPLAVSLTVFLIVKWVHGQDENHSIYFLMLGMISALVYRLRHEPTPASADGSTDGLKGAPGSPAVPSTSIRREQT